MLHKDVINRIENYAKVHFFTNVLLTKGRLVQLCAKFYSFL
jgi:hypothetical protein